VSDDAQQTSTGLSARLFNSARYPSVSPPTFDETTDWPVDFTMRPSSLHMRRGSRHPERRIESRGRALRRISVGLGFGAKLVANPTQFVPVAPLVDTCP
jgi:hypothetical protein